MKISALSVFLASVAAAKKPTGTTLTADYSYDQYLIDFGKQHGGRAAQVLFESRIKDIIAHNSNVKRSYTRGVNHLTDEVEVSRISVQ